MLRSWVKGATKIRKTEGRKKLSQIRGWKPSVEDLEARQLLTTVSFQEGVSGYTGQEDTVLYSRDPNTNFGTEGSISPDQQDSNGVRQGLVSFDGIIGDLATQIPLGAKINSATFTVDVVNDSNSAMQMSLYRMQTPWSEGSATWNSFGAIGGVQASEGESSDLPPDAILFDPDTSLGSPGSAGIFDVTRSLEYWAAGADNNGWMIESAATNGWDFRTKESPTAQRPRLVVDYDVPASNEFQILSTQLVAGEGSGTALIEVSRMGDLSSAVDIDYSVTAGTATGGGTDFDDTNGTISFAADQAFATISVPITNDTALEGFETFTVQLTSGGTFVAGRDSATISIADDDALINEVLANVSNAIDETDREYIELIGTPGASLTGYTFVVFEGEEEEGSVGGDGSGLGVADFVVDLDGLSFGSNGLLVLAPTNWEYAPLASAGTNVVNIGALDGAGGVLEDASQTYALVRGNLVQDTDYDTIGTYENDTNQAIGTGVGLLDSLPAGTQVVDSVGVVEGGGGDRDRVLTTDPALVDEGLGHPGVHVHQPTRINGNSGNVTSDAVSRRAGQTLPNSLGVWFNGDIGDGDATGGPIAYENDTFFISVVAPDGAVLTPGAPNDLRTVFFALDDQDVEVAEAAGSVTVTIERTGDLSEDLTIEYQTVDVSAIAGIDYTATSGMHTFDGSMMEDTFELTIPILSDMDAEGFERFRVEITSASGDYLITNGQSTQVGAVNGEAVVTIADANVDIATFQNGVNGYFGTSDTFLDGQFITTEFGFDTVVRVDQVKGEGEDIAPAVRPQQGLLKFDDIFGNGVTKSPQDRQSSAAS